MPVTLERVKGLLREEVGRLQGAAPAETRLPDAAALLEGLVAASEFPEFLTLEASEKLG
jgi:hypothetical protein